MMQLMSSRVLFNLKVESAVTQIQDALERSTDTILLRVYHILNRYNSFSSLFPQLDSGPHDLIEDPDIRRVWKGDNFHLYNDTQFTEPPSGDIEMVSLDFPSTQNR